MAHLIACRLHQALGYTSRRLRIGMGCCQLDGDYTVCNGNAELCEKPDLLIQHVLRNLAESIKTEATLDNHATFISLEGVI